MKVSIIGAGNVGATLAQRIAEGGLGADVVLLDIAKEMAEGKALDLLHAAPLTGCSNGITGTDDYSETSGSDIAVITAGSPRAAGMTRDDLIAKNSGVIKSVLKDLMRACPGAIIIIVTNPLDVMTYLACKVSGLNRERVFGMAGVLDTSRFAYLIADALKIDRGQVETLVIGQHGPEMVPLLSRTRVRGRRLGELMAKEDTERLLADARNAGTKVVKLLGKGSAYYAPSAALFHMIKTILKDEKRLMSVSCLANGEYGLSGVCTGLPVRLGRNGIEEIVELQIDESESEGLRRAAGAAKDLIGKL